MKWSKTGIISDANYRGRKLYRVIRNVRAGTGFTLWKFWSYLSGCNKYDYNYSYEIGQYKSMEFAIKKAEIHWRKHLLRLRARG